MKVRLSYCKDPVLASSTASQMDRETRERFADCMAEIAERQSRSAFAEIFEYFAPRLKSYMLRLGANASEAEELTQEVMVTVWRKAAMFDREKASVSTWIFRVARNRRIDAQRKLNKPALDPDEPLLRPPDIETPDSVLGRSQIEETVRAELTKLPQEQLQLLQAAFYEGLSHSEIAEAFNLPLGTVKSRIRLAFNKLRGGLDNEM